MNRKLLKLIRLIFTTIVIILAFVSIILLLIKLTGHSPSENTIIISVVGILVALQVVVISILFEIKEDIGNLKEFKRQTISKVKEIEIKL